MAEPMSDERLASIRAHLEWTETMRRMSTGSYPVPPYLRELVEEVERLRTALAQEQREHANCEQFHHEGSMAKNTAMAALMDVCDAMAAEGDFDSASDETRRMVRSILNRRSQGGEM